MASPFLYFAGAPLSQAELTSACLDGHLIGLGEGFIPADMVESAALRAASLSRLVGEALAVTHESAAWVHGRLDDPPARHSVQRAAARRPHHVLSRRAIYRDPLIPAVDLQRLGGVLVSSPTRTLADLARSTDASSLAIAAAWIEADPREAAAALAWLERRGTFPRKKGARMLLLAGQDEVTR